MHSSQKNYNLIDPGAIFHHATEAIIVSNDLGEIVLANPAAELLFGYTSEEFIGNKIEMLVPERFASAHVHQRDIYNQAPVPRMMGKGSNLLAKRKDGNEFPVDINLSPYQNKKGKFVIAFIVNISLQKQTEELLRKACQSLEDYSKDLKLLNNESGHFNKITSHDLQEPLRKIMIYGSLVENLEKANFSERGKVYFNKILGLTAYMKQLLKDLGFYNSLLKNKQLYTNVDLNIVLQNTLKNLEPLIKQTQVQIESTELPVIKADPLQMNIMF